MLPAAGQGALGIEIRSGRPELRAALAPLAHPGTWLTVNAERAVSRRMGGSCSMPLAAHGHWQGEELVLRAAWGEVETETGAGSPPLIRASSRRPVTDLEQAADLGEEVAELLLSAGARQIAA